MVRSATRDWWAAYKQRHESGAVTMKMRDGVWQPSRLIPCVERVMDWAAFVGMGLIALSAGVAIYWNIFR